MKNERKHDKLTDLMALVVFAVFAVCVLGVLLTGAEVYRNLVERSDGAHDRRTASGYIATRVRQADRAGAVTVEDFGGCQALVIRERINGREYLTRIYCHEGSLRELFAAESGSFQPEDGELLFDIQEAEFSLSASVLTARITLPDGSSRELILTLRSSGEVSP